MKDMIDVYALAHCAIVNTAEINEIIGRNTGRELGSFNEFYNRREDVKHAYGKLYGIITNHLLMMFIYI